MLDFKSLKLLPRILESLAKKGYTHPTPIQAQVIPHLLEGRDVLGIAQTGTGKTAAFSLPLIQLLFNSKKKINRNCARALILTPTRELASQINENIVAYNAGLGIKSTVIFGGVGKRPQINAMRNGVEILIATPGRLLDLISENYIDFDQLEYFILDEADRMLDMGFIRDIKKIIALLPKKKQTLLFSATMPKDIIGLATALLKNPVKVEVTPENTTVEKIDQSLRFVDKGNKTALLLSILKNDDVPSVLVFGRTKHGANKIVKILMQDGVSAAAIHGNKSQTAREKALSDFKAGKIRVLVATDIAARGIDIPKVGLVINFDLPNVPESYVHRIGRTARAGRDGMAIAFCDTEEKKLLKDIEKFIGQKIPVDNDHPYFGVAPEKRSSSPERDKRPSSNASSTRSKRTGYRGKKSKTNARNN